MTKPTDGMSEEQKKLFAEAVEKGIENWLDKQFSLFGKWAFFGLLSAGLATLAGFIVWFNNK